MPTPELSKAPPLPDSDARVAKLPTWAQLLIRNLRMERDQAMRDADNARMKPRAENAGSRTFVTTNMMGDDRVPIDKYARVEFMTGDGHERTKDREGLTARLVEDSVGTWLELSTVDSGIIYTRAYSENIIRVKPGPMFGGVTFGTPQ